MAIYKGTNLKAYKYASRGKNAYEKSKLYYKYKKKDEKKDISFLSTSLSYKAYDRSSNIVNFCHNKISNVSGKCLSSLNSHEYLGTKPVKNKLPYSGNNVVWGNTLSDLNIKAKERVVAFLAELVAKQLNLSFDKVIKTIQIVENIVEIGSKLYKVIIKFHETIDKLQIYFENVPKSETFIQQYEANLNKFPQLYTTLSDYLSKNTVDLSTLKIIILGKNHIEGNKILNKIKSCKKTSFSILGNNLETDYNNTYMIIGGYNTNKKYLLKYSATILNFEDIKKCFIHREYGKMCSKNKRLKIKSKELNLDVIKIINSSFICYEIQFVKEITDIKSDIVNI